MGSIGIMLPLVHCYGINFRRWTYRSWTYPWIHKGMNGADPGHATIRAKICSCSIALASLVSSSWRSGGSDQRFPWQKTNVTEWLHQKTSKQTQLLYLYHSYHLTFLISSNANPIVKNMDLKNCIKSSTQVPEKKNIKKTTSLKPPKPLEINMAARNPNKNHSSWTRTIIWTKICMTLVSQNVNLPVYLELMGFHSKSLVSTSPFQKMKKPLLNDLGFCSYLPQDW